jgi:hypothetical protein
LKPKQHSAAARAEPGSKGRESRWRAAEFAEVVTVIVVEVVPGGVTVDGEKLHDAPVGNPDEQLNDTDDANPYSGVTANVVVPLCPAVTVNDDGEGAMEKSGLGRLMVYVAEATVLLL